MIDIKAIRAAAENHPSPWPMSLQPATVLALCDEIESLRKDAARYRWMRSPITSHKDVTAMVNAVDSPCEEQMDAAIDAAMESK